ncbi:MAG: hypothetical protein Q9187_008116 [Circinaria calcarea]
MSGAEDAPISRVSLRFMSEEYEMEHRSHNEQSVSPLISMPSLSSYAMETGDIEQNRRSEDKNTSCTTNPNTRVTTNPSVSHSPRIGYWNLYNAIITDWWSFEVLSWILGAAALITVVVILQKYDGKSLSSWTFPITPNSMISLFATISKAALLLPVAEGLGQLKWIWFRKPRPLADIAIFDSASRGPLGALQLVLKGRPLSTLGALLVITALAVDPFVQQVITYSQEPVRVGSSAIFRARGYHRKIDTSGAYEYLVDIVDLDMKAAFFNGLYNPKQAAVSLEADCLTGNCTWPSQYSSLAICSTCADITNRIRKECSFDKDSNSTYCKLALPLQNGPLLPIGLFFSDGSLLKAASILNVSSPSESLTLGNLTDTFARFASLSQSRESQDYSPPKATECTLYFCVNTYEATVSVGVLNETVVSSWRNESGSGSDSDFYRDFNSQYKLWPPLQQGALSQNSSYYIDRGTHRSLKLFVESQFYGEISTAPFLLPSTDSVQAFMGLSNYDALMSSIALSMTNNIRKQSNNTVKVPGDAWRTEAFIHVAWAWLTLPIVLVIFTLVFLVTTIWQSSDRGSRLWKTSTLPLLYHGLEPGLGEDFKPGERVSDMEIQAKKSKVRLQAMEKGIMLVSLNETAAMN